MFDLIVSIFVFLVVISVIVCVKRWARNKVYNK
jgi:hypothetical protein